MAQQRALSLRLASQRVSGLPGSRVASAMVASPAPLMRMAFCALLTGAFRLPEPQEVETLDAARMALPALPRPLMVVDGALVLGKPKSVLSRLVRKARGSVVVLYGTATELGSGAPWLECGVDAVLDKRLSREEILEALHEVMNGASVVRVREEESRIRGIDLDGLALSSRQLRPRHKDVLRLIGRGLNNQDIADTLGLRVPTVKHHTRLAMSLLQVATRTQAALCCNWMSAKGLL